MNKRYTKEKRLELAELLLSIIPKEKLTDDILGNDVSTLTEFKLNRIFSLGSEEFNSSYNYASVSKYNNIITASIVIEKDDTIYFKVSPDYGRFGNTVVYRKETVEMILRRLLLNACSSFCNNVDRILNDEIRRISSMCSSEVYL